MELTKKRDREKEGALTISKAASPWRLAVRNSWVLPYMVTPAKGQRIVKSEFDKKDLHIWGIGIIMIVRYSDSPVGPYDELLYSLPFKQPQHGLEVLAPRRLPVIYVSSEASLRNGRENWGIRKELADFKFKEEKGYVYSTCTIAVKEKYSQELLVSSVTYTLNIPFPVHLGLLGILNPAIVERKIDEEGEVSACRSWFKIRALGFGWAKLTLTFPTASPAEPPRLSPFWFGAYFGLSMAGTLIFPEPAVLSDCGSM